MREFDKKMLQAYKRLNIKVGDIFESCNYHPVLCLGVDYKADEIWGISLIDGTHPQCCSLVHCGIKRLSPKQAWKIKTHGPLDLEVRDSFSIENRWWNIGTENTEFRVRFSGPRKQDKKKDR